MKLPTILIRSLILVLCCVVVESRRTLLSTAPTVYCIDSTLKFDTKDTSANKAYNGKKCKWVSSIADKVKTRCGFKGVKAICPATCGSCDACSNTKATFYIDGMGKSCQRIETNECSKKGVFHACRRKCGSCPSSTPSSDPSALPSEMSSLLPSMRPTPQCNDSPLLFLTFDSSLYVEGKCKWIGKKNKNTNCELDGVSIHCPDTCGSCSITPTPCSDSPLEFWYKDNTGRNKLTKCSKIKQRNIERKCKFSGIFDTCKARCGACAS